MALASGDHAAVALPSYVPKEAAALVSRSSLIMNWIETDGEFPPEANRYHLFINFLCGWSHRTMLVRAAKGLENVVTMSHVGLDFVGSRSEGTYEGWSVPPDEPTGNEFRTTFDVYNSNNPTYGAKQLAIPILFDTKTKRVVNNDSVSICFMFAYAFDAFARRPDLDLYPSSLRADINQVNNALYPAVQNGVYTAGFASDDASHEAARTRLYEALDATEQRLALKRSKDDRGWLCGESESSSSSSYTMADLFAFCHHFRFDAIYHFLFLRGRGDKIATAYPNIAAHVKRVYDDVPGAKETCDLHLATVGYAILPSKGKTLTPENAPDIFRKEKWTWYPDLADLLPNRAAHGLKPDYPIGFCTGYTGDDLRNLVSSSSSSSASAS